MNMPQPGLAGPAGAGAGAGAWRRLDFYESRLVRDATDFASAPLAIVGQGGRRLKDIAATCACRVRPPQDAVQANASAKGKAVALEEEQEAGGSRTSASSRGGSILVGFTNGELSVLNPADYTSLATFYAFGEDPAAIGEPASSGGRITHLSTDASGRVITVGEEAGIRFPILRIWDIRKYSSPSPAPITGTSSAALASKGWRPRLLAEAKIQHGARPTPVACVAHTPSLSFLSVGLADGTVLLMRGVDDSFDAVDPAKKKAPAAAATGRHPGAAPRAALSGNVNGSARPGAAGQGKKEAVENGSASQAATPAATLATLPKFKIILQQPTSEKEAPLEPLTGLGLSVVPPVGSEESSTFEKERRKQAPGKSAQGKGALGKAERPGPARSSSAAAGVASGATKPASVYLYIVTPTRLLLYVVLGTGAGSTPSVLDDVGCALGCSTMVPSSAFSIPSSISTTSGKSTTLSEGLPSEFSHLAGKMVLARDEAIYVVGSEGREACFALEGAKASVKLVAEESMLSGDGASGAAAASHHLVIVSPPFAKPDDPKKEVARLVIFDLDNKLIAYSGNFDGGIRKVWIESSAEPSSSLARICVLNDEGTLTRLEEKPLRSKLDVLFRKSLFLLAINLAKTYQQALLQAGGAKAGSVGVERAKAIDPILADIHRRYAEHLYSKGDFEAAMNQFVKTIGWTQPSYVIRKVSIA